MAGVTATVVLVVVAMEVLTFELLWAILAVELL